MPDLICRKTMIRCQTPGMCSPHGGCSTSILKEASACHSPTIQPTEAEGVEVHSVQTREGYDVWDKLCAIPRYGFIHSPDNRRVLKAEGIGNWIDRDDAMRVVDDAQSELNLARAALSAVTAERDRLREDRDSQQRVCIAEMEKADQLRAEVEALRKDADRYQWLRGRIPGSAYRIAGVIYSEGGDGVDAAIDAAMAAKEA